MCICIYFIRHINNKEEANDIFKNKKKIDKFYTKLQLVKPCDRYITDDYLLIYTYLLFAIILTFITGLFYT